MKHACRLQGSIGAAQVSLNQRQLSLNANDLEPEMLGAASVAATWNVPEGLGARHICQYANMPYAIIVTLFVQIIVLIKINN